MPVKIWNEKDRFCLPRHFFFLHVNKLLDAQVVMIFRALDHCDQVLQGENFI